MVHNYQNVWLAAWLFQNFANLAIRLMFPEARHSMLISVTKSNQIVAKHFTAITSEKCQQRSTMFLLGIIGSKMRMCVCICEN